MLSFATQGVGSTSVAQTIMATNATATTVSITSIAASGGFAQTNTCGASLTPAATCSISVTFTPTVTGSRTGSVTVTFNGVGSPQTASLTGKGISQAASQLAWKLKAPFNDPRTGSGVEGAAANLVSGKLYVSHGFRGFGDSAFLSIYDVATDAWTHGGPTAPDAAVPRSEMGGGTALGKHFAIGGRTGPTAANEQFDPSTTLWTTKASMSMARGGLGAASFNDKIYAVGGRTGPTYGFGPILNLVEVYDPQADAWTTLAPLPVAVSDNYATVALNGKIYVFGGTTGGGPGTTNLVQIYDIASNAWSSGAPMPTARGAAMAGVIAGKIAVFGGVDATLTDLAATEFYDPVTDRWQPGPDMASPASEIAQGVTSDGTQIFAVGSGIFGVSGPSVQLLVAPVVQLSPRSLAMGAQTVDTTSSAQTVAVTNVGGAALPISNIAASGDFVQTNNCPVSPATLATRASCTITITFTPKALGTRTGTVTITDLALDGPQTVSLTGTGVAADFSISPASSSSTAATVTAGQAATYSLSLAATPGFTAMATLSCSGAPAGANCTVSPPSLTLSATPSKVTVTATTTARSLAFRRPELRLPSMGRHGGLPLLVWLLLLMILASMAAVRRRRAWPGVAVTMLLVLFWAGCGGVEAHRLRRAARPRAPTA